MDNKLYNVGDSLIVRVIPQQNGITTLTGYVDELLGLDANHIVQREFRIIEDDMFYSDWMPLNSANIQRQRIKQKDVIEIRYTRLGSAGGIIEFKKIDFSGDFEPKIINSPITDNSVFSEIAWNDDTEKLARNLFKKLYFRGIVPNYIKRGENSDIKEDGDYIDLFYSVAKFFAVMLRFFKRFENFNDDEELMREWIRQNGINFDESSITLEQLQFIAKHLYDEIRKRGTNMIFKREGDVVNGDISEIDGEFIRLIRSKREDELIYEYIPLEKLGWCLGVSSPLYRGTSFAKNLNKTKENSQDFIDLDNFKYFAKERTKVSLINSENRRLLNLNVVENSTCGLGRYDDSEDASNYLYTADPEMDYEITFMLRISRLGEGGKLCFGVEGFDALKNKLVDAFITPNNELITDWFTNYNGENGIDLSKFRVNQWYFVRGIIHAYSSDDTENVKLNIGFGNNLTFNNKFLKYILPKIWLNSSTRSVVRIWDYKIRPLVRGTNILPLRNGVENSHSLGFIQTTRIFYSYFRNKNNNQSKAEITDIIERYLLPFNMVNIFQFIGD